MSSPSPEEARSALVEMMARDQYNAVWGGGTGGITNGSWVTAAESEREPYRLCAERMLTAALTARTEPEPCVTCGGSGFAPDYTDVLERMRRVRPRCESCHGSGSRSLYLLDVIRGNHG